MLAAVVVVFVWDRLPVAVVAVGVALTLWATGVLGDDEVFQGFGDPTVIFIASLFVVSEGLDASGVTAWAGQALIARAGTSRTRLVVLTMLLVAALTMLISVNGAVAALVPVAVVTAVRLGRSPSQLLIPVAFAAHAGSLLALTGTPVNVIVSEAAGDAGVGTFGFFEFALVGVPLVLGTIAIVILAGERLLPHRSPRTIPPDFSEHARTLVDQYELDHREDSLLTRRKGVAEVVIPPRSEAVGGPVFPGMVTSSGDFVVLAVQRKGEDLPADEESVLAVGDTLLLQGTWDALDENLDGGDVLLVDPPELVRRQAVPLGAGAKRALAALAVMGATLADGGVNPVTGERVVDAAVCRDALAVMTTAGLYETSGDWLYDIGLPGKSGIGGGIVTVSPGKGGLGTFAPRLDAAGNSVKGQLAARFLSEELGLDLFASAPAR